MLVVEIANLELGGGTTKTTLAKIGSEFVNSSPMCLATARSIEGCSFVTASSINLRAKLKEERDTGGILTGHREKKR